MQALHTIACSGLAGIQALTSVIAISEQDLKVPMMIGLCFVRKAGPYSKKVTTQIHKLDDLDFCIRKVNAATHYCITV